MITNTDAWTYEPLPKDRVLSIDPVARGYGFVVVEAEPLVLIDWGVRTCARKSAAHCELSLGSLIGRYEPTAIVIEDPSESRMLRRASLDAFLAGVSDLLASSGVPVFTYSRAQVRIAFGSGGIWTKDAIAAALAERFPEIIPRLPKPRRFFDSEDVRMSIFDALSFAVTHLAADHRERRHAVRR
jgi:Holliday junction resolvasome RuvABC endonuclease subunit